MGPLVLSTCLALGIAFQTSAGDSAPPGYTVGPQDVLNVTVFGEPQLTGTYTVGADGGFNFPWVGRIDAGGLTVRDIEQQLVAKLADGYLRRPEVSVQVQQFRSQFVFVVGEVRTPGKYPLTGEMSLLEAIAAGGSTTAAASREVMIMYPKTGADATGPLLPDEDAADVTRVSLDDLQIGRTENLMLRDGATVYIPKAETFFVTGQVKSPGSYVLQSGMTVLQAVSLAGGLTERGSNRRIKITRVVDGEKVELGVKLTDLVKPGDTIVIAQRFF